MIEYAVYKFLHVLAIVVLVAGLVTLLVVPATPDGRRHRRLAHWITGVAAVLALVSGFGLHARLGGVWQGWVVTKVVVWLALLFDSRPIPGGPVRLAGHGLAAHASRRRRGRLHGHLQTVLNGCPARVRGAGEEGRGGREVDDASGYDRPPSRWNRGSRRSGSRRVRRGPHRDVAGRAVPHLHGAASSPGRGTVSGTRLMRSLAALGLLAGALLPGAVAASTDDPACARWRKAFARMPTAKVAIIADYGRLVEVTAKLAHSDEERLAGFQCATRDDVRTTVIVFDFHREVVRVFHMKNVPAPLDIAFVKASGQIFSILRMDPSPTETYRPSGAYWYAIKARAGFFKDHGISQGAYVAAVEPKR